MLHGIEVHQSIKPDAWVILMDQPFRGAGEGVVRAASLPDVVATALRCDGMDSAIPNGSGSTRHDDSALGVVPRFVTDDEGHERPGGAIQSRLQRQLPRNESDPGCEGARCWWRATTSRRPNIDKGKLDSILKENHLKGGCGEGGSEGDQGAAHRTLPALEREYRRRLDALDSGTIPVPVHQYL